MRSRRPAGQRSKGKGQRAKARAGAGAGAGAGGKGTYEKNVFHRRLRRYWSDPRHDAGSGRRLRSRWSDPLRLRSERSRGPGRSAGFDMADCLGVWRRRRHPSDRHEGRLVRPALPQPDGQGAIGQNVQRVSRPTRGGGQGPLPHARLVSEVGAQLPSYALRCPPRRAGVDRALRARREGKAAGGDMDWLCGGARSDWPERGRGVAGWRVRRHELRSPPRGRSAWRWIHSRAAGWREQR